MSSQGPRTRTAAVLIVPGITKVRFTPAVDARCQQAKSIIDCGAGGGRDGGTCRRGRERAEDGRSLGQVSLAASARRGERARAITAAPTTAAPRTSGAMYQPARTFSWNASTPHRTEMTG